MPTLRYLELIELKDDTPKNTKFPGILDFQILNVDWRNVNEDWTQFTYQYINILDFSFNADWRAGRTAFSPIFADERRFSYEVHLMNNFSKIIKKT